MSAGPRINTDAQIPKAYSAILALCFVVSLTTRFGQAQEAPDVADQISRSLRVFEVEGEMVVMSRKANVVGCTLQVLEKFPRGCPQNGNTTTSESTILLNQIAVVKSSKFQGRGVLDFIADPAPGTGQYALRLSETDCEGETYQSTSRFGHILFVKEDSANAIAALMNSYIDGFCRNEPDPAP